MNTQSTYDPHAPVPCDTCWRKSRCKAWCGPVKAWLNFGDRPRKESEEVGERMTFGRLVERHG